VRKIRHDFPIGRKLVDIHPAPGRRHARLLCEELRWGGIAQRGEVPGARRRAVDRMRKAVGRRRHAVFSLLVPDSEAIPATLGRSELTTF
jgi:hypothetical protein